MKRILITCCVLCLGIGSAAERPRPEALPRIAQSPLGITFTNDLILFTRKYAEPVSLPPGPYDGSIAKTTAWLLGKFHYARLEFDDALSSRFLDRYLDALDGQHLHFFQPDIDEFNRYRTQLDDLTLREGDTSPANRMFARLLQRAEQRVEYVAHLLETERFEFSGHERYTPIREKLPRPQNLEQAREVWRQHLRFEFLQEKLAKTTPEETLRKLQNRYKNILRSLGEFDADDILQLYLTALARAYDPHSDYMGRAQLENFAISMKLSLFGIGALLRSEDGYCKIQELLPGGPALRSKKIKPNDRIVAVAQGEGEPVDVVDMKLNKVVELIRGPKGTPVTLTVVPASAADTSTRYSLTLVRDEIKLEDQEAKARILDLPGPDGRTNRIGLIDLPSFYTTFDIGNTHGKSTFKSTTADVARLLEKLKQEQVSGVVLDLRKNGGGSLEEAIRLTGLFVKEGPIVQVRDPNGDTAIESDPDKGLLYDGPLVVLTSHFSASASEILAAALQDYGRALIVGDAATHGKGTVQTIYELSRFMRLRTNLNPGALKVTIRKFYRANGASTQLKGVTPDLVLPSLNNHAEIGESHQDNPLPWDTIPSARFEACDYVQPALPALRERLEARMRSDPEWGYVREDVELFRQRMADRSVSLNEAERLKEKEEADARMKARKEARLARGEKQETVYELTVKLAGEPGLPPPRAKTNAPPDLAVTTPGVGEPRTVAPALTEVRTALATNTLALATNTTVAATTTGAAAATADDDETDPTDKSPVVDIALEETKRILLDLVALWPRPVPVIARP